jgi:hypothetical protein
MNKQSGDWSDDDSSNEEDNIGEQPNRDFPPSEDEDEEDVEEYDMEEIRQLTMNQYNTWTDIFKSEQKDTSKTNVLNKIVSNNVSKPKIQSSINNIKNLQTYEKRKFNPRLPSPDKYKKNNSSNSYKLNRNEFPTLK